MGDNTTIFYNPFRKKWVMSVRRSVHERGRARFYYEVDDFAQLAAMKTEDPVFWSGAEKLDPPDPQIQKQTQLYCLSPIAYESIMLGAFAMHYGPENDVCQKGQFPKLTEIELGYSRDGFHFARPDRTSFIAATKREGDWDRGYLRPIGSVCTVVGDRLYFYYCGFSGVAPDGQKHFYAGGSTHVAFLRRDGFAFDGRGGDGWRIDHAPRDLQRRASFRERRRGQGRIARGDSRRKGCGYRAVHCGELHPRCGGQNAARPALERRGGPRGFARPSGAAFVFS